MVSSPLGDTEKRLLGCWGWLGKSKFCRTWNKQPISENMKPVQPGQIAKSPTYTLRLNSHIYCAHSQTNRWNGYSHSMNNFIYPLVNQPYILQYMYTLSGMFFCLLAPLCWEFNWISFIYIVSNHNKCHLNILQTIILIFIVIQS